MKHSNLYISLILLICLLSFSANLELIPLMNGTGWDGSDYAKVIINFDEILSSKSLSPYLFQRIGLLALVHYCFKLCSIVTNEVNIVLFFRFFNAFCILVSAWYYYRWSSMKQLAATHYWLGFLCLFINFSTLKQSMYNPVLLDSFAFLLAMGFMYYYEKEEHNKAFFVLSVGIWTFPTFVIFVILLIFQQKITYVKTTSKWLYFTLPLTFLLGFGLFFNLFSEKFLALREYGTAPIERVWLPISLIFLLFYLYFINKICFSVRFGVRDILKDMAWRHVIFVILIIVLQKILVQIYSNSSLGAYSFATFAYYSLKRAVALPANFLVAHGVYFGLLPLFLAFKIDKIRLRYLGEFLFLIAILLLFCNSESRQNINFYPVIVLFLLPFVNNLTFSNKKILFLSLFCICTSFVWLQLSPGALFDFEGDMLSLPIQSYMRFCGPWVSFINYKNHVIFVIIGLLGLRVFEKI